MAFYLSTKGQLHPYRFKYLEGAFEKARMERTQIHSESSSDSPINLPITLPETQKEFFAIDVMTKPIVSLTVDSPLNKVRSEMKKHGIRHIPLIKEHVLVGIISDRDLLKVESEGTFMFLKAEDIMTSVLVVAEEETPLAHIARVLLEEKISALPVINQEHKLVGMISRTDILKTVVYNRLVLK